MSKKIISIVLAVMLMVSMISVAMVSASAEVDANGRYAAAEDVDTNRYFFYMPDDWYNEYTSTAGVYWWDGTDACPTWQDMYAMYPADAANVWYVDVPTDVNTIIFTNFLDGGEDPEADVYVKAVQTTDIGCEYYDAGESPNYPDGTESFDNMIYVPDPDQTVENPFSGKLTYAGEWFYYHGNGQWDTTQGEVPTMPETPDEIPTTAPVEETTVPETDPVVTDPADDTKSFTVTATSNFSNTVSKTYSEADETVTLTYYLKTDKKLLEGEFEFTYDPSILKFKESTTQDEDFNYTVMPKIEAVGGDMTNIYELESTGTAMFTFTNPSKLYDFTQGTLEENVLITATFDIVGDYTKDTEVNMNAKFLTGGEKQKVDGSTTVVRTPYVDYSVVQDAYANCENLTTLSEPAEVPTEPTTEEPTTEETTVAPTETTPASKSFKVTAKSNFSNTTSKTYSEADKTVTLTYYLKTDKKLLEGEFEFTYDPSILRFNEEATMDEDFNYTVMPKIEAVGGDMTNIYELESTGTAMFTFTNPSKLYDFTQGTLEENVLITLTFDIVGDYTKDTEVNMNAKFLTGGEKQKVDGSTTVVRTPYVDYSVVQDAYANCENLTVLSEPAVVPTEPTTEEPTTEEPTTEEPTTEEPTTEEPTTEEPTEEPTTVPVTTEPSDKSFTVTAKSNFSNTTSKTYSEADKTVTLTYYLKTDKKLLEGELEFSYDPSILRFNEEATMDEDFNYTVMPKIEAVGGDMTNIYELESTGTAMFTFTNPSKLYDFTQGTLEDNVFITLTFDIVGDYTKDTEVFMNAKFLTGGEKQKVDGSTTVVRTPYVDYSETKPAYANCENLTVLSEPVVRPTVEPTTVEPTTVEPTTVEPTTVEPTTVEPTTVEPTTTEPVTTEPVDKEFTVTAKSNIANAVSQTYTEADKTVTVTYTLETLKKILSGSWTFNYDPSILQFQAAYTDLDNPTSVMPYIAAKGGDMQNLEVAPGEAIGSFSNANGYDFSTEQVLFTAVFDIVGDYTTDTEVVLIVDELLAGNVTADNTIELERLVVDGIPGDGFTAKAYLSQFTPVPPTTVEPTTVEPTTEEPTTVEPTTEPTTVAPTTEPVTTEPVTTEPVTTEPATTEPVTTEPVTTEPATTEPVTTEPVTTEPVTTEPSTTAPVEPDTTAPVEPDTTAPVEPDTTAPVEPDTTAPVEPDTTAPVEPDTTAPVEPDTTVPATTVPGATSNVATPDTPGSSTDNGTVQTSDSAMAFVLLAILVAATGFIIVLRKRETE